MSVTTFFFALLKPDEAVVPVVENKKSYDSLGVFEIIEIAGALRGTICSLSDFVLPAGIFQTQPSTSISVHCIPRLRRASDQLTTII